MRAKQIPANACLWLTVALALLTLGAIGAQAAEVKLQAFLLWGTDDSKPPEGKAYQPVNPDIRRKLKELPLKWTNWFEVKRVECEVAEGVSKEVTVSDKCQLNVSKLAGSELEVTLIGKGKEVVKRKQSLPKGEMLVLGGNAPNATAWLVVLKRIE